MMKQKTMFSRCWMFVHRFMKRNSFETGLNEYHHMIYTILKTKSESLNQRKLIYCNIKQFNSDQFKLDICTSMSTVRTHAAFENNFVSILDKHAPKKTKILRGNQKPISIRTLGSK